MIKVDISYNEPIDSHFAETLRSLISTITDWPGSDLDVRVQVVNTTLGVLALRARRAEPAGSAGGQGERNSLGVAVGHFEEFYSERCQEDFGSDGPPQAEESGGEVDGDHLAVVGGEADDHDYFAKRSPYLSPEEKEQIDYVR